jgi:hypothetical protein
MRNLDAVLTVAGVDGRTWAATLQPIIAAAEIDGHPDSADFDGVILRGQDYFFEIRIMDARGQ